MAQVRYIVENVDQAVAFYTRHLGFERLQQFGAAMAIIGRGDLQLWLAGPQASASQPLPDGTRPMPGGWSRIVIPVEDLDKIATDLHARGVTFRNDILPGPGGRQILCEDPSGNPVELFESA